MNAGGQNAEPASAEQLAKANEWEAAMNPPEAQEQPQENVQEQRSQDYYDNFAGGADVFGAQDAKHADAKEKLFGRLKKQQEAFAGTEHADEYSDKVIADKMRAFDEKYHAKQEANIEAETPTETEPPVKTTGADEAGAPPEELPLAERVAKSLKERFDAAPESQKKDIQKNIDVVNEALAKKEAPVEAQVFMERELTIMIQAPTEQGFVRRYASIWTDEAREVAVELNREAGAEQIGAGDVFKGRVESMQELARKYAAEAPDDSTPNFVVLGNVRQARSRLRTFEKGNSNQQLRLVADELEAVERSLAAEQGVLERNMPEEEYESYLARLRSERDALFLEKRRLEAEINGSAEQSTAEDAPAASGVETSPNEEAAERQANEDTDKMFAIFEDMDTERTPQEERRRSRAKSKFLERFGKKYPGRTAPSDVDIDAMFRRAVELVSQAQR